MPRSYESVVKEMMELREGMNLYHEELKELRPLKEEVKTLRKENQLLKDKLIQKVLAE